MNHLFSHNFLAAISQLTLVVKPAPPRVLHGEHQSALTGASLEFRDFSGYAPGDDLRRVDWNIYQRTRHLFLRRFEHPTTVPLQILLDASASMFLETPTTRFATAARLVAAVASAALNSEDTLSVAVLGDAGGAPPRPISSRQQFVELLGLLSKQQPGGRSGLSSIHRLLPRLRMSRSRGVLVIVSDFFEPDGVEAIVESLRLLPHRLVLLRITQPWDEQPRLLEDTELLDCESDDRLTAMPGQETYRRYLDAYHAYFGTLQSYAKARDATSASFDASRDTVVQLQALFPQGVLEL